MSYDRQHIKNSKRTLQRLNSRTPISYFQSQNRTLKMADSVTTPKKPAGQIYCISNMEVLAADCMVLKAGSTTPTTVQTQRGYELRRTKDLKVFGDGEIWDTKSQPLNSNCQGKNLLGW